MIDFDFELTQWKSRCEHNMKSHKERMISWLNMNKIPYQEIDKEEQISIVLNKKTIKIWPSLNQYKINDARIGNAFESLRVMYMNSLRKRG